MLVAVPQYCRRALLRKVGRESKSLIAVTCRYFFEEKYTTDESEKILKVLNGVQNEEEFKRYIISNKRIDELLRLREEKGTFTNLDDLIPIMGTKVLEKFYGSMLEKRGLGLGNPVFPPLTQEQISSVSSVLSFNITANYVSWSLVHKLSQNSLHLDALNVKTFELVSKGHFLDVLRQMNGLAQELPPCDLYICEEFPTQVPSSYMFSFVLQMTQARSLLLGCLASKSKSSQIISIKTAAVAKLFNTYIGFEKVSGQHLVNNMFETSCSLEMNSRLRNYYLDSQSQTKEHLSNVFLLNLAYWKLTNHFSQ